MSFIEVKNLTYSYDGQHNVLSNVSFEIKEGSYTTVVGHNGSGKSTLARLLMGLLAAKEGTITIGDKVLSEESLYDIRGRMGIVFQNPDNQFIGSTVEDDIAFGLENHCFEPAEMPETILKYGEKVGIAKLLKKEPGSLSGGQKQRVAVAGVLAMRPDIIIFDEATSMLDPKGRSDVRALIEELHSEGKYTIISITHDIEEMMASDDCIVLNKGELYLHDAPEKVFAKAAEMRKIGLDIPFNMRVKEAFNKTGIRLKSNDLEGMAEELWQLRLKK